MDDKQSKEEIDRLRTQTIKFYTDLTNRVIKDAKEQATYRKARNWVSKYKPDWFNEQGGVGQLIDQFLANAMENASGQIGQEAENQEIKK